MTPANSVELLGFTIDQHLTFKDHIDKVVRKSHGILGVINRAKGMLPQHLLKLCYTSLVRPHLEFCSQVFAGASKTNLAKLDTVQKIASRIICGAPRDAHSEPLLDLLSLQSLTLRRQNKIIKSVNEIINNNCHPYLINKFDMGSDGLITNEVTNRTSFAKRRFSICAREIYNNNLLESTS